MMVRTCLFSLLVVMPIFISNAAAQTSEAKRPFLIVDTNKLQTSTTHVEQQMRFIASSAETGGATSVFESIEMPGYKTNLHRHNNSEETFYILEGTLTVNIGGKTHHLGPGSYVFIPRGTVHAQGNLSDKRVRFITTVTPGGIEVFFKDRAELLKTVKPGDPEFNARYRPVLKKHEKWIEIIGPWDITKP